VARRRASAWRLRTKMKFPVLIVALLLVCSIFVVSIETRHPGRLRTLSSSDFSIDEILDFVNKAEKVAKQLGYKDRTVSEIIEKAQAIRDILKRKETTTNSDIKWGKVFNKVGKTALKVGKVYANLHGIPLSDAESGYKMSNADALNRIRGAGISIHSSGGCFTRTNSRCTSLDQVNSGTIDKIITLRQASGCPITITGGTEVGHASGTYSHWNGYKLDITPNSCIDGYIKRSFTYAGVRGDGAPMWKASSGSVYAREGNHWDILYP